MAQSEKVKSKLTQEDVRKRAARIFRVLKQTYPNAQCSLEYHSPFQLLVATILSAQCTDERVNQVTPRLFKRFPNPQRMASAQISELELLVRSTGFYRNKALSLKGMSQMIVEKHKGRVPQKMEELVELRGIGRKTANVVLGNAFGIPGVVVDTHMGRLSRRMGFTKSHDPEKIEVRLMEIFPKQNWILLSHLMISHGRAICTARRAYCEKCPVSSDCPRIGV